MPPARDKPRGPNYTANDKSLLLDCVSPYLPIVQNTKIDNASIMERKRVWDIILADYNDKTTTSERTLHSLQCCYDNLKRVIRQRVSKEREVGFNTEDGQALWKPDPVIDRVREFIEHDRDPLSLETTDPLNTGPSRDVDTENITVVWDVEVEETPDNQENTVTVLEDEVEMAEHTSHNVEARKQSNWQRGTSARVWNSKPASIRANFAKKLRRRATQNRIVPSSAATDMSASVVEHKLELTKLHLERVKAEADIKLKILKTELKIKEAVLEQERLKIAKLKKELELKS